MLMGAPISRSPGKPAESPEMLLELVTLETQRIERFMEYHDVQTLFPNEAQYLPLLHRQEERKKRRKKRKERKKNYASSKKLLTSRKRSHLGRKAPSPEKKTGVSEDQEGCEQTS